MRLHFIFGGGKTSNEFAMLETYFSKRLDRYAPARISTARSNATTKERMLAEESERIIRLAKNPDHVILFDERGKAHSSEQYAGLLEEARVTGTKELAVIVGGAYGVTDEVRKMADLVIAFSPMTFPHQLARILALEQTYRALDINHCGKYHHN